ncbi:putative cysteine ligase BshC [Flavobacterium noncentrifugens]|uniref:Putative cysteine ligase BshC n=1 Tax=Flavobacterium noncentrifugens TaxID=1128970 RepID=A0A1G8VN25_9FLAO|nr:bacillithiol biosynthesis cysteine-adding enzyme BshC [Flavobacterium noncentrifugens]GEP50579.1 putative cysteine ligase BshC [Flavobacterium noncentrifugens]SDJ67339.1 bacillithiol biosynthesis cysteine-adding enzyme BshC [Flavobacterium noncentrifugens]
MPTDCISYQDSGYFTPIMNDYLNQKTQLQPLYNRFPTLENFGAQILEKQLNFNPENRKVLSQTLQKQYKKVPASDLTLKNIELLQHENTFTITTGHQLNLFTGPLYFLYKIISTINLVKQLKAEYPQHHFVPIYWMATEDHDFEEINYFTFKGKKFRWNKESSGPVGRLSTAGLDEVFKLFALDLGPGSNAETIKTLFSKAYLKHENLADATRWLANALFKDFGLVIIEPDDKALKTLLAPYVKRELLEQVSSKMVSETTKKLEDYNIQVNPREINLFYIEDGLRERIIFQDGLYYVNHTKIKFTEPEILETLENHPEKFSPNVIMRPLYQEAILPNLCYIGGGGELAYWLELKAYFNAVNVTFPILLLRNSVMLATEKQAKKADRLFLSWSDLFMKQQELVNRKTREISEFPVNFEKQKILLKQQFEDLMQVALKTDKSFTGAVEAQQAKQIKGLENLEKRLLKAQKRKYSEQLQRITDLQNELFPNKSLQERQANFAEFYLESGKALIQKLLFSLHPLENDFDIIVL